MLQALLQGSIEGKGAAGSHGGSGLRPGHGLETFEDWSGLESRRVRSVLLGHISLKAAGRDEASLPAPRPPE